MKNVNPNFTQNVMNEIHCLFVDCCFFQYFVKAKWMIYDMSNPQIFLQVAWLNLPDLEMKSCVTVKSNLFHWVKTTLISSAIDWVICLFNDLLKLQLDCIIMEIQKILYDVSWFSFFFLLSLSTLFLMHFSQDSNTNFWSLDLKYLQIFSWFDNVQNS